MYTQKYGSKTKTALQLTILQDWQKMASLAL